MDIVCSQCATEYEFDDDKVTEAGVTVKCANCGFTFKVRRRHVVETEPIIESAEPPDAEPKLWMVRTAQAESIPYQMEVLEFGGTDARAIQLTRAGVPAGCLSIPCRYVHSPSEMVDYNDVQNAVRLLVELLRQPVHME